MKVALLDVEDHCPFRIMSHKQKQLWMDEHERMKALLKKASQIYIQNLYRIHPKGEKVGMDGRVRTGEYLEII